MKRFKDYLPIILMFISFYYLDIFIRIVMYQKEDFAFYLSISPNLFTISYIILFITILSLFKKNIKRILFTIFSLLMYAVTYSEYLHLNILKRAFDTKDLFLIGEGADYFLDSIKQTDLPLLLFVITGLSFIFITQYFISKEEEKKQNNKLKKVILVSLLFIILHTNSVLFLGKGTDDIKEKQNNKKVIYTEYTNQTKSLEVSGIYELFVRSFTMYVKDTYFTNLDSNIKEINSERKEITLEPNKYSGIYKDKNVIYILMESIDSWLVNDETMPTLSRLQREGLNFTSRYAPAFGGGPTINSEFAMNTGLYAETNGKSIMNYKNTYPYSLANMLKKEGYSVESVHFNSGKFYNRASLHKSYGYIHHSLKDDKTLNKDIDYQYDSNLLSKDTLDYIIRDNKFLTFITTYSPHLPHNNDRSICKTNKYNYNDSREEINCIYNLARDTDEFIKGLIEELEKQGKLDNTILVLATDHENNYKYFHEVIKNKDYTNDYLMKNVPLVIWSNDTKHEDIDTICDTVDILPTLFNMLGVNYDQNNYIGEDIFKENRNNFVYFDNITYFDGKLYSEKNIEESDIEILKKIEKIRNYNKSIVITNYFKEGK